MEKQRFEKLFGARYRHYTDLQRESFITGYKNASFEAVTIILCMVVYIICLFN